MNDQIKEAETCRNCVFFESGANSCNLSSFSVDPDGLACGDFLDEQEFQEEML